MLRFATFFALMIGLSGVAHAGDAQDITVSGQQTIAIIDANNNGELGDDGDCTFSAIASGSSLEITPSQDDDADNPLRVCQGPCEGFGSLHSSSAVATITDCEWGSSSPGAPFVPACVEAGSTVPSSSGSPCQDSLHSGAGAGQGTPMLTLNAVRLFYPGFEFLIPEPGFGFLCNAGGVAAEVATISGRRVITPLTRNGNYLCGSAPFELLDGSKQFFDACVPVNEAGTITLALGGDQFAVIPLADLPGCGGRDAAPTASDLGLVALGMTLLALGAWTLGRRPGFSASLPQI